jgi:hypothetical protein
MAISTQPLSIIADVTVVTSAPQVSAPPFNKGLFVGPSTVITAAQRTLTYLQANWSAAMLTAGFIATDPEYLFAQIYFSQSPPPSSISIGVQVATALQTITIDVAGTGWAVNDTFLVVQGGATLGYGRVTAAAAGVPTAIAVEPLNQGSGYVVAAGLPTTAIAPSTGIDLTVNITAVGETLLQAFTACRISDSTWYCGAVSGAVASDHEAISAYTQSQVGTTYFGTTGDAAVLSGTAGNVLITVYATSASRTWMQYATTQAGLYPNQIYFVAAVMGQAMASNSQLQNSAFTEKFSGGVPLIGVVTEPNLTTTQIANIEGTVPAQGPNGNLFLNYGSAFNVLEQGTMMAESVFFDQILNLDILAANIQFAIMDVLTSVPKVPQTDAGQQLLIQAVESALDTAVNVGFIAAGIWRGQTILGISNGTSLPSGYSVQSPKYSTLTQAQVQSRIAPPIYVALIEAGAVHFVTIQVLVQV